MAKEIKYNENDRAIVGALKGTEGMTLAELSDATGIDLKPGNVVAAMKKGLVEASGEREVLKDGKRKVTVYNFITDEVLKKEDGKAYTYTENEAKLLATAKDMKGNFTLAELADAMSVERLTSGAINALVKKGNIGKEDEKRVVPCKVKATVKVYTFVKDILDAE